MPFLKLPFLKKFCCCMKLVTGIRVISGFALISGDCFIIMGAALFDDYNPSFVLVSSVSLYITGGLLCLWFLFLLLFQSMSSKLPRIVVMMHTKVLMAWLLVVIVVLNLSKRVLSKYKDIHIYRKEDTLISIGIFYAVIAFVTTTYSFWILKSYIDLLEAEEMLRPSDISIAPEEAGEFEWENANQDLRQHQESSVKSLGLRSWLPRGSVGSQSTRSSQAAVSSDTETPTSTQLPSAQHQEDNGSIHQVLKNNDEIGIQLNKSKEDNN